MTLDTASMFAAVRRALRDRDDLAAWSLRQITSRGTQLYAVPAGVEARRSVTNERFVVDVLRQTRGPAGAPSCGAGNVTLLPGDDIGGRAGRRQPDGGPGAQPAAHHPRASRAARSGHGRSGTSGGPDGRARPVVSASCAARLRPRPASRVTAAEFFAEEETVRLVNSRGIDASQTTTSVAAEWVLIARDGAQEVESFVELTRRRAADLHLEVRGGARACATPSTC